MAPGLILAILRALLSVFNMADSKPSRVRNMPKRLVDEISVEKPVKKKKTEAADNNLYEIEIKEVDVAAQRLKIHFKGYDEKFDEWRPFTDGSLPFVRLEKMSQPSTNSLQKRLNGFNERIYREIKRRLFSGRKDDAEIRIEIPIDVDVFNESFGSCTSFTPRRGKEIYAIDNNDILDVFFGLNWNERIINEQGDFAYVVPKTVKFWLTKRKPIIEFKLMGNKYIKTEIDDGYQVVFTFVRGDGNSNGYKNMVHV